MPLVQLHLLSVLVVGYPDAVAVDVRQGLRALVQAIQAHEMGNRHGHGLAVRRGEGLGLLAPLLNFLAGVGLLGKVDDPVRKESLRCLSFPELMLDALAALAEVFKGVGWPHVVKAHEFVRGAALLGFLEFAEMLYRVLACLVGVLEHGVIVEAVHGHDVLAQGPDRLRELLKLCRAHLIDHKHAAAVADMLLCLGDQGVEGINKALRQIRIPGISLCVHVGLDGVTHLPQVLQIPFVGLCGFQSACAQGRLAHEVDAFNEVGHGLLNLCRDVRPLILIARIDQPLPQGFNLVPHPLPVLPGVHALVPALAVALQVFISALPLFQLHHAPCLFQHSLQDFFVFKTEKPVFQCLNLRI